MTGRSLFARLIGPSFDALPPQIRRIHEGAASRRYAGHCAVRRGGGLLSRIFGGLARLPAAGERVPLSVSITTDARGEVWSRAFGGRVMRSTLRARAGLLEERLGPLCMSFRLSARDDAIDWHLSKVRSLGIPLPSRWFRGVSAREWMEQGLYHFDVQAGLTLVGPLVHYHGSLDEID